MIVIALALLGAVLGWLRASKRGGNTLDRLQYAAAFMLVFAIVGLFATVIVERMI